MGVNLFSAGTKGGDFDADELKKLVIREFANQFFTLEQVFVADVAGNTLKFQVIDLSVVDLKYVTGETNKKEGKALPFSLSSLLCLSRNISSYLHCTLREHVAANFCTGPSSYHRSLSLSLGRRAVVARTHG